MTNAERRKQVQEILGVTPDRIFGPKTRQAFDALAIAKDEVMLVGDGTWPWSARIDGDDIVIENARVTCFGGTGDKMDSGETASGISTAKNPGIVGCALPMRRDASKALRGSPIPRLPWKTQVMFSEPASGKHVTALLIDEGPAKWTGNAGDLTVAAARVFNPKATANNFEARLNIRIIGGRRYVS